MKHNLYGKFFYCAIISALLFLEFIAAPVFASTTLALPVDENGRSITAEVDIYSGRTSPKWAMSKDETDLLKEKLKNLPISASIDIPSWGYVVVANTEESPELPYEKIYFYQNAIIAIGDKGNQYFEDTNGIGEWLVGLGDQHDPSFVPPLFETLPPNTPYIAVVPSSIEASVEQGKESKSILTVFSEGNAGLQGTITTPQFISADHVSFSLPEISGAMDVALVADTKRTGKISGDVVVKSNDPNNPEIKIPIDITVTAAQAPVVLPLSAWQEGARIALYILVLILLAGIAGYFVWRKKKAED
jgi:hypothetical protein